jgi:uncharacterized protein (DUF1697 family)
VLFDSPARSTAALEKKIEAHLRKQLGYDVDTFIRSRAELAAVAAHEPFARKDMDAPSHRLYVLFTRTVVDPAAKQKVEGLKTPVDEFHVHGREVYWLCRTTFTDSQLKPGLLDKALGGSATSRNITTVRKLAVK